MIVSPIPARHAETNADSRLTIMTRPSHWTDSPDARDTTPTAVTDKPSGTPSQHNLGDLSPPQAPPAC